MVGELTVEGRLMVFNGTRVVISHVVFVVVVAPVGLVGGSGGVAVLSPRVVVGGWEDVARKKKKSL